MKTENASVCDTASTCACNMAERGALLRALRDFLNARPGLTYNDYGDQSAYRRAQREVAQQHADGLALLRTVSDLTGRGPRGDGGAHLPIADVLGAFSQAWCGRLAWTDGELDFTAGQNYSTEYRGAACAVLACALKGYWRNGGLSGYAMAREAMGAGVARRWFK